MLAFFVLSHDMKLKFAGGVVATKLKFETGMIESSQHVPKLIMLQRNPSIGRQCRSTTIQVSSIYFHIYIAKLGVDTIRQSLTLDSILLRVSAGVYNVRFSIEGRVVCDGMYFPEGEMPLQLRIKVTHILFLHRLSLEFFLNSAPEKSV